MASEEIFEPVLSVMTFRTSASCGANTYNKFDPTSPFGGYKESGFVREGGSQGLAMFCRMD